MNKKQKALIEELNEYLPYDNRLLDTEKQVLLSQDYNSLSAWGKTVYDYFYSHLDAQGNPISLNQFLLDNDCKAEYYKKVDKEFIDNLFSVQKPLFFFDVDNTLTERGFLSQQKIDFIKSYEQKYRIILTTGKTYDSIKNVIDDCELQSTYASCLNGSVLVENGKLKTIEQLGSISEKIVKDFDNAPFDTVVYYNDNIRLVKPLGERSLKHLTQYNEAYFTEDKLDYSKVVKVLFFIFEGETEKEQIVIDYVKNYEDLVCMRTSENTYEILKKTQHKGNTVKIISKLLGNHYRATIGAGDSMNDSQLLNHVGKPYLVATASDDLKYFGYEELDIDRNVDIVKLIKKYTEGEDNE